MNNYTYEYNGYFINPHKEHPASYVIVTTGQGGKIPNCLSGLFTSRTIAKIEIDTYLANKPTKEKGNDETLKTGGSK